MRNLRLGFRLIAKSPGFSALVVATLALGIGSTTAFFSLVDGTVMKALPYPAADRLVVISQTSAQAEGMSVSYPDFQDWQADQDAFSGLAIYRNDVAKLRTPDASELVNEAQVSADFFPVVGLHAAQGRDLLPSDDKVGAPAVVWLTFASWQRYFHGAPGLVGQSVMLGGKPTMVAGILPKAFRYHRFADVYVPIEPLVDSQFMRERGNHSGTSVLGRLKAGATIEQARAQLAAISKRLEQQYPKVDAGVGARLVPLREHLLGDTATRLYLLLGAVVMVLLITCVNVANMLLARSFGRQREMAIRTALGATRADLFRQLMTESLLLAAGGGILGVALAFWGYRFAMGLAPWEMQEFLKTSGGVDSWMLLFVAALTLVSGVAFGLAPAWRLSHASPQDALKNTQPAIRTIFGRFHSADVLVLVQVLLAVVLLVNAGLLVRSLRRVTAVATGLSPEHVLSLRVSTPPASELVHDPVAFIRFHQAVLARVQHLGAVESAAEGSSLPYTWNTNSSSFFRTDRPTPEPGHFPSANSHVVTPGYFRTVGIPLVRGAMFDGHERPSPFPPGQPVSMETLPKIYAGFLSDVVISRKMAEQYWPGENPMGKTFRLGLPDMHLPEMRIVGVVGNTTQLGAENGEQAEYYTLLSQWPATTELYLVARMRGDAAAATETLRRTIREVAPDEPIFDVEPLADRISDFASGRRFSMELFAFFAITALLLATTGIYGVLACYVGQRTREIGIRMALGAQQSDILANILGRGLRVAGAGAVLGLAGAWMGSGLLQSQLFGLAGTDATTYAVSGVLLMGAALVACALPARRAARLNPTEAMRTD